MKKRIVSVLLIATMSVGLFSGCGKSGETQRLSRTRIQTKLP